MLTERGSTFRELVSGSTAFNAVSRSSLVLAMHPDDGERRVLVRGKGNLARTPQAVEFDIADHQFEANGYEFKVPLAVAFGTSDFSVDDLLDQSPPPPAGQARTTARKLIAARLADGEWHHAGAIIEECAQVGVHGRAADDLGVERERRGYPAQSLRFSQPCRPRRPPGRGRARRMHSGGPSTRRAGARDLTCRRLPGAAACWCLSCVTASWRLCVGVCRFGVPCCVQIV